MRDCSSPYIKGSGGCVLPRGYYRSTMTEDIKYGDTNTGQLFKSGLIPQIITGGGYIFYEGRPTGTISVKEDNPNLLLWNDHPWVLSPVKIDDVGYETLSSFNSSDQFIVVKSDGIYYKFNALTSEIVETWEGQIMGDYVLTQDGTLYILQGAGRIFLGTNVVRVCISSQVCAFLTENGNLFLSDRNGNVRFVRDGIDNAPGQFVTVSNAVFWMN